MVELLLQAGADPLVGLNTRPILLAAMKRRTKSRPDMFLCLLDSLEDTTIDNMSMRCASLGCFPSVKKKPVFLVCFNDH